MVGKWVSVNIQSLQKKLQPQNKTSVTAAVWEGKNGPTGNMYPNADMMLKFWLKKMSY